MQTASIVVGRLGSGIFSQKNADVSVTSDLTPGRESEGQGTISLENSCLKAGNNPDWETGLAGLGLIERGKRRGIA